jgi:hypothetical protein
MNQPRRPAATGAARIREGYLSADERRALAELFDTVQLGLEDVEPVPSMIRDAWLEAYLLLHAPREVTR